jgi:hypothetical protein
MAKKATDVVHVNLRLHPALWKQLETAAKERDTTLSGEIRQRLEQSFRTELLRSLDNVRRDFEGVRSDLEENCSELIERLKDATRSLEDTRREMHTDWRLYSTRLLQLRLERELIVALERANDLQEIKNLARVWLINYDEVEPVHQHKSKKRGE